jgi:hypothetical protein
MQLLARVAKYAFICRSRSSIWCWIWSMIMLAQTFEPMRWGPSTNWWNVSQMQTLWRPWPSFSHCASQTSEQSSRMELVHWGLLLHPNRCHLMQPYTGILRFCEVLFISTSFLLCNDSPSENVTYQRWARRTSWSLSPFWQPLMFVYLDLKIRRRFHSIASFSQG